MQKYMVMINAEKDFKRGIFASELPNYVFHIVTTKSIQRVWNYLRKMWLQFLVSTYRTSFLGSCLQSLRWSLYIYNIYNIRFREYHRVSYGIKQIVFGMIYRSIISFLLYNGNFCSVYRKLCDIVIFLYEELFQIISNSCLSNAFDLFIKIVAVRFRNITHSATARRAPKRYLKRRPTNIWLSSNFSKILYYNSHFCIYENNK